MINRIMMDLATDKNHDDVYSDLTAWGAVAEWFNSALDLCSDGQVVKMWVQILAATVILVSLSFGSGV